MNLLDLMVKIGVDDQATAKIASIANNVKSGMGAAAKTAGVAFAAVGASATAFGASAVNAGMTFDKSMSQVAATMGKTSDEMQSEVGSVDLAWGEFSGNLREYAQEMGAHTAFSATQAADALNYMALAGYDTQQAMNMLPNVLNLAAAGSMELADASDMVTDAQSALGLSAEETTTMVDQMAMASSKTNTSVAQLGSAMLTIGGTAKGLSGGTAELSQALGLLADNGIKGAEGGTALRNIMLNLTPKSEEAAAAMEKIGLNAYDAEGNMRPLKDIFLDLNKGMEGMTQKEKQDTLAAIFNKVDLKSINALMGTNAERWDEVAAAIGNADGAAQKMADTQLDNLAGDITLFQSALEGFQIAISDTATGSLREVVQFGSDALSELTTAVQEGGTEAFVDKLAELVQQATAKIGEALPGFVEAVAQIFAAVLAGMQESAPMVLEGLAELVGQAAAHITENSDAIAEGAIQMFLGFVDAVAAVSGPLLEALIALMVSLKAKIVEHIPDFLEAAGNLVLSLVSGLANGLQPSMAAMEGVVSGAIQAALGFLGSMFDAGGQLIQNVVNGIVGAAYGVAEAASGAANGALQAIGGYFQSMGEAGGGLIQSVIDGVSGAAQGLADTVSGAVSDAIDGIGDFWQTLYDIGGNIIQGLVDGIWNAPASVSDALWGAVGGAVDSVESWLGIASPSKLFKQIGGYTMEGFAQGIEALADKPKSAMLDAAGAVYGAADGSVSLGGPGAAVGGSFVGGQVVININNPVIKETADADELLDYITTKIQRKAGLLAWNPSASMA